MSMFQKILETGQIVEEVPYRAPHGVFAPVAHEPFALLLDSTSHATEAAATSDSQWSFIATDPFDTLTGPNDQHPQSQKNPFPQLHQWLHANALPAHWLDDAMAEADSPPPPFTGGIAGLWGYDLAHAFEALPSPGSPSAPQLVDDTQLPTYALGLYDVVLAFNHHARRCFLISTGAPETSTAPRAVRAQARAAKWRARLTLNPSLPPLNWPASPRDAAAVRSPVSRSVYQTAVAKVIDYIFAGDIFQANLSRRFEAELQADEDAFLLYRRLCAHSPAPFAGFFNFGAASLLSSSPERFLKCIEGAVETKPIKGTRPRGATAQEDARLGEALRNSQKDTAENVMIVDLLRNDLSRTCQDGSIKVPDLCKLEHFATVHHLVSTITGQLRGGTHALDLLSTCFPGGSITGAPKIRAMEIIAELEPYTRGPYCGSLGYVGFDGTMDTNILIRTMTVKDRRILFHAGGGIVADSKPDEEYDETTAKAAAMIRAVRGQSPTPPVSHASPPVVFSPQEKQK